MLFRLVSILTWLLILPRLLAAYNAADTAADPAYGSGWQPGSNGGAGFGAWRFDKASSQYAIASSPAIDANNRSWAITAEYGSSAIRPLLGGSLAPGQTVQVAWTFPGTNAANSQVRLLDANDNPLVLLLNGAGYFGVATNNVYGPGAGTTWATNGVSATVAFTMTATNAVKIQVVSGSNSVMFAGLLFTGLVSEVSLFVDGSNDTNQPNKTAYFNQLLVNGGVNQVAPPVFNPAGGMLTNGQLIALATATTGATIRYTTDGSMPTETAGTIYTGPFTIIPAKPTTLYALGYETGLADSPVSSAVFDPPNAMRVGMNVDGVVDYSTEWPFVDVFKRTRVWMTRNLDNSGAWDSGYGAQVSVDANGWPTQVPFAVNGTNQMIHTILVYLNEAGIYDFIYEGTGSLYVNWYPGSGATLTATGGVQSFTFTAVTNFTQAAIEIHSSSPADYLRNFHLVLTNYLGTYPTQPFHPLFLQRLQPFTCLRFMDWGMINGSPLISWTNRTTPDKYTQAMPQGVALEYIVQLGNTLQKDIWICIPHEADDDYVTNAARLIFSELSPGLRVYVEYSNETWNSEFSQTAYVQDEGVRLNLDPAPFTAGQEYVGIRSAQIWRIFQQVFGASASQRLVKVLATQSANPAITTMRLAGLQNTNFNPTATGPDVLAIAPYFGTAFTPSDLPPNAAYPTVDDIETNLAVSAIASQVSQIAAQKAVADANGWNLVGYEGGQTYQGIYGAQSDTNLTAILTAANGDPRMFGLYTQYLNMLQAQGVSLYNNFSYCGAWGEYGSWGSLQYQDEPLPQAPKYAALVQWITYHPVLPRAVTLSATVTNHAVLLSYGPVAGSANYTVQGTTQLMTGNWQPVTTLTGWTTNGTQISVFDTDLNETGKFYRVLVGTP